MLGMDTRTVRTVWTVVIMAAGLAALFAIRRLLLVLVFSLLLAYLLGPVVSVVDRFALRGKSRTFSMAVVYLAVLAMAASVLFAIGARVAEEAGALAGTLPRYLRNPQLIDSLPLPAWFRQYQDHILRAAQAAIEAKSEEIMPVLTQAGKGVIGALGDLAFVLLVPILSFLMMKEGPSIRETIVSQFGGGSRALLDDIMADVHLLLIRFMRAMMLLSLATFTSFAIALGILGVPYALLLSLLAGAVEFVPVAGPLVAAAVILIVSFATGYAHLGWVVVFLIVYRLFLDYVLQPYLMGHGIELPPLAIIIGVLAGEQIAGILGMFLSIPVLATLRIIYVRYRKSREPVPVT